MPGRGVNVAIYDPSAAGGITHYTFQLAESLVAAGCRVTLITSADYELKALQCGFDVWYLFRPSWLRTVLSKLWRIARPSTRTGAPAAAAMTGGEGLPGRVVRTLKTVRFMVILARAAVTLRLDGTQIVHVHWLLDRRADLLFIRTLQRLGIRIVYTVHNVLPHDEHTPENKAFFQGLYGYPDTLIVHSEKNRKEMLDLCRIDPERLHVIPHGRHGIFFERVATSVQAARNRLAIPSGVRVILFFGLIKRYKGLEHLLQAFDTISARCSDVFLLIAGRVPDNDPESRRHYQPILARYDDRPDIRFDAAYVPFDRVGDYFLAADLVVIPYTKASQSGVLLTAYAAGRAVIATDVGGLGEVVKDGITGFLVQPRSADALATAAITLLDNDNLRESMGREAQRLAESTYAWTPIAEATLKVYKSLVPGRQAMSDSEPIVA